MKSFELEKRKKNTVTLTQSIFYSKIVTEKTTFTVFSTIEKTVKETIFVTSTVTNSTTLTRSVPTTTTLPITITVTPTLTSSTLEPAVTSRPDITASYQHRGLNASDKGLIAIGSLLGLLLLLLTAWWIQRWVRGWKARQNPRMVGVHERNGWEIERQRRQDIEMQRRAGERETDADEHKLNM